MINLISTKSKEMIAPCIVIGDGKYVIKFWERKEFYKKNLSEQLFNVTMYKKIDFKIVNLCTNEPFEFSSFI